MAETGVRRGHRVLGSGYDTHQVMPFGTPDDMQKEVRRRIEGLTPGGASVFNQPHNIQERAPPENITAMYETA